MPTEINTCNYYCYKNCAQVGATSNIVCSHQREQVGLGVTLWEGEFEGRHDVWLRWCYQDGIVLLTGDERATQAEQRARLLAEQLRAMGIDPETL